MICEMCAMAADYGAQHVHKLCTACDCHHAPIEGEPRLVGDPELSGPQYERLSPRPTSPSSTGPCYHCSKPVARYKSGIIRTHKTPDGIWCPASGRKPV